MNASGGTGGGEIEADAGVIGVGGPGGAATGAAIAGVLAWLLDLSADGAGVGVGGGAEAVV